MDKGYTGFYCAAILEAIGLGLPYPTKTSKLSIKGGKTEFKKCAANALGAAGVCPSPANGLV